MLTRIITLCALMLLAGVARATCPQGSTYPDGCSAAPSGTIEYPHIQDTQQVYTLAILGGSGYTNGTYTWTSSGGGCSSNASGQITVSGGLLGGSAGTSFTVASEGAGCTSRPTIAVPGGAGAGTGGSITAQVHQVRAPWNAPGVDYYVGIPSGTSLLDPTNSANLPTGASFAGHTVSVTGCNVTLNGFDFTISDTSVSVTAGSGCTTTIENSKFLGGTNQNNGQNISWSGAGNLIVQDSEYNGGAPPGSGGSGFAVQGWIISTSGSGNLTLEYDYCHDADSKCFQITGGSTSGSPRIATEKYNLFTDIGTCHGNSNCAHGETEYFYSGSATYVQVDNEYNTYYDNFWNNGSIATSISAIQADNLTINGSTDSHNIWIMPGPGSTCTQTNSNAYLGAADNFDGSQNDPGTAALDNVDFTYNYLDGSGAYFNWYHATKSGSTNSGLVYSNNTDLGSGGLCNDTTTPLAAPTASPAAGTYASAQSVTLSTPSGATVKCWSTSPSPFSDGTGSGCGSGNVYSGAVTVSSSETLYWVAGASANTDSQVQSAQYTIGSGAGFICPRKGMMPCL